MTRHEPQWLRLQTPSTRFGLVSLTALVFGAVALVLTWSKVPTVSAAFLGLPLGWALFLHVPAVRVDDEGVTVYGFRTRRLAWENVIELYRVKGAVVVNEIAMETAGRTVTVQRPPLSKWSRIPDLAPEFTVLNMAYKQARRVRARASAD